MPASRRYRIVVSRRRKNPGALGAMAAYRDARLVRGDLHRFQRPGDRPRLQHSGIRVFSGIGCGGQSHRDRCASPWPMAAMAGAEEKAEEGCTFEAALDLVRARMAEGLSTKDAVKQVAKLTGFAKNLLYDAVVK